MKKRILIFFSSYFPLVGGAEVAVKELTDRLPEFEFDLLTARLRCGLPDEETVGRVRVRRLGFGGNIDKFLLPFLAWRRAERLHRRAPYDAVWVVMASYAAFGAVLFKLAHRKVPMLLTLQEGDPPEWIERKVRLVRPWFTAIFRLSDGLQTISRFLMEWGRKMGCRARVQEVVPNGVNVERFATGLPPQARASERGRLGFASDDFVIVTASRLVVKNGVDLLIGSLSLLPPRVKLLVAGAGDLEGKLKAQAAALGVAARVVFAGEVGHDRLPALLAASDAFCRPSRSEGLGNAFIEAMAAGLPTVGTPVGGIPDVIQDGRNGLMVEPESSGSVAAAIGRLLDDPALARRLAEAGKASARGYAWESLAGRMAGLFGRLFRESQAE
jgi:glycosyltransferase involved in cell wall biosynthesis